MSKKLFLSLLPLMALAMTGCQRGNGGSSSSGGSSSQGTSSQDADSSEAAVSSEEGSEEETTTEETTSEEETGITYTITTGQDWVFQTAGVPIFAHYWDGVNPGEWAVVTYETGGRTGTFVIPSNVEAVGFLVVRCSEGTALEEGKYPNWEIHSGDEPGRIYNKTGSNTDIVSGTTEYTIADMVEYNG